MQHMLPLYIEAIVPIFIRDCQREIMAKTKHVFHSVRTMITYDDNERASTRMRWKNEFVRTNPVLKDKGAFCDVIHLYNKEQVMAYVETFTEPVMKVPKFSSEKEEKKKLEVTEKNQRVLSLTEVTLANMSREKFLKLYGNLPLNIRKEVIVIVDDEPISWDVAYIEVKNKTPLSKKILEKLEKLEVL